MSTELRWMRENIVIYPMSPLVPPSSVAVAYFTSKLLCAHLNMSGPLYLCYNQLINMTGISNVQ